MTPATYRTMREACGLSVRAAATFHNVKERTILYWQSKDARVPDGVANEITDLDTAIEDVVSRRLVVLSVTEGDVEVILSRYYTPEDYENSTEKALGWSLIWPAYVAMVGRLLGRLRALGLTVQVDYVTAEPSSRHDS